jgi:two-component system sensor kinase FixL
MQRVRTERDWISAYLQADRRLVLSIAAFATVVISIADAVMPSVSLGLMYIFPILAFAGFVGRVEIALIALICTLLRREFSIDPAEQVSYLRLLLVFSTFYVSGLFVSEICRNRRLAAAHFAEIQQQAAARQEAEEELRIVVDTSPAAILITDGNGCILRANSSARALLGEHANPLEGSVISDFLPSLETVPRARPGRRQLRSSLECRGRRADGTSFLAQVWLSTYSGEKGPRMAAIILDASENLRERDSGGLRTLMLSSRILMGAVSHSVRNLCAAARVAYVNLTRRSKLAGDADFEALGTVVKGLEMIASSDLDAKAHRSAVAADLGTLIDELRIIIEPSFAEIGAEMIWAVPSDLPAVLGEHSALLHAMLNVAQNSQRALAAVAQNRMLQISVARHEQWAEIRFRDNGGGVRAPERLFQLFESTGKGAGIGLYVSRAILRSFDGELHYEPVERGSIFSLHLRLAGDEVEAHGATA